MLHDIRTGQEVTYKELLRKGKILVTEDIINFSKKKVGGGFPEDIAEEIAIRAELTCSTKILIIEDLYFTMTNKLLELGADLNNIYLAFGEFKQLDKLTNTICLNKTMQLDLMKKIAEHSFEEPLNIISLQEAFEMKKFDLIIANPPYGSIGANITKTVIDNIEFDQYINLLPANDYKRNKEKNLFKYVKTMTYLDCRFEGAVVATHIADLAAEPTGVYINEDEFEIAQFIDKSLTKYFTELRNRPCSFRSVYYPWTKDVLKADQTTTFILAHRDVSNGHLPYSKKCTTYKWNVEKSITPEYINTYMNLTDCGSKDKCSIYLNSFSTTTERNNFVEFMYSEQGFKFLSKVFTATNINSSINLNKVLPAVDWTRSWTVEEILRDYDYTEEEIKEVLDDLKNYKGMND